MNQDTKLINIDPKKEIDDMDNKDFFYLTYQTDIMPETNEALLFNYNKQEGQQLVTEKTTLYKIQPLKVRLPKSKAQEIQQRVKQHIKQQIIARTDGEQIEQNYLAPAEYISKEVRTTQHLCPLCGGPHLLSNCLLKSKKIEQEMQRLQAEGKQRDLYETVSYSIMISPIPSVWEKKDIKNFVEDKLRAYKSHISDLQYELRILREKVEAAENNQLIEGEDNFAKSLKKEQRVALYQSQVEDIEKQLQENEAFQYTPNLQVQYIVKPAGTQICYVNFLNEQVARKAADLIQGILLEQEKLYMNSEYRGKRVQK